MFCLAKWIYCRPLWHVPCCSESIVRAHTHTHTLTPVPGDMNTGHVFMLSAYEYGSELEFRWCRAVLCGRLDAHGKMRILQGNMGTRVQTELITEQDTNLVEAFLGRSAILKLRREICDNGARFGCRFPSGCLQFCLLSPQKKRQNHELYLWKRHQYVKWPRRATVEVERLLQTLNVCLPMGSIRASANRHILFFSSLKF